MLYRLAHYSSFLLVAPLADSWLSTPSQSEFRDRCIRAERLAYDHFRLPHARGAAPRARLDEADDESSDSDADADADEANEAEHDRASLSAFPAPCTLVWGKLDGVRGNKVPAAALAVTHVDDAGASTTFAPVDVARIEFRTQTDGFAQVSQSSLFNSAQLSSMYSNTGSRCHLVLCFEALLRDGDAEHELDTSRVLYTHALHAEDERDDPRSPYESRPSGVCARVQTRTGFSKHNPIRPKLSGHQARAPCTRRPARSPQLVTGRSARSHC